MQIQSIIFYGFIVLGNCKFLSFFQVMFFPFTLFLFHFFFCFLLSVAVSFLYDYLCLSFRHISGKMCNSRIYFFFCWIFIIFFWGSFKCCHIFPILLTYATATLQASFKVKTVAYFLLFTLSYTDSWNWLYVIITK